MHVPDGFINAPVSVATGVVAVAAVAVAVRGARRELNERTAPLAGVVAAFIFAAQMINFPVANGTSGHLLGGALAAVLVGPYTGILCVSIVIMIQGLVYADGGLTALGTNITDMAIVTVIVGFTVTKLVLRVLPKRPRSVVPAAAIGALVSVPAAAAVFTLIFAIGGEVDMSIGSVFVAMVGVHVLIGIGEAVITGLTVAAIVAVRPDLVYAARGLDAPLELRSTPPDRSPAPTTAEEK